MSEVIFEISRYAKPATRLEGILEIVKLLLADTDIQVRLKLIDNIFVFNE